MFTADDLIHSHSRTEAIADGVLVELDPKLCQEAGIRVPVAMTAAAYADVVAVHETAAKACQDVTGRMWDVLWMLWCAAKGKDQTEVRFLVYVTLHAKSPRRRAKNPLQPAPVQLKAVIGPADDGSPCITIMWPEED